MRLKIFCILASMVAAMASVHAQTQETERAAGTYFLLSSAAPQNIFYKVRQMQNFFRMKAFRQSAEAGKAILQRNTIPVVAEAVGDSYSIGAVLSDGYHTPKYVQPWLDRAVEMIRPDSLLVSRINQQYGLGYYRQMDWNKAIEYYTEAYRYNPEFISAVSTVAYCYEQMKDYKSAAAWYEKYLTLAKPGSKGYNFAKQSLNYLKGELFMEE